MIKLADLIEDNKPCGMYLFENVLVSENLKFHLDRNTALCENIFRTYSESYFELIEEVRKLYYGNKIELNDCDAELVESDLGKKGIHDGREVYLDAPIEEEEDLLMESKHRGREVRLNRPFRTPGGPKKFSVYVKNKTGNVIKVSFGDPNLRVRSNNPKAAKSFRARHKCHTKKDKTTAGYWSCNISRYRKKLGIKSSSPW